MSEQLAERVFSLAAEIRYVATYVDGELQTKSRSDLANSSGDESDWFEELLVNPTLLKLATQRGDIDCGGLDYLLIRYGNFFQFLKSIPGGQVSVALEPESDVQALSSRIVDMIDGLERSSN